MPLLVHFTVLKLHLRGKNLAQIGACPNFFSGSEAGLTNRVTVRDSRAGALLFEPIKFPTYFSTQKWLKFRVLGAP